MEKSGTTHSHSFSADVRQKAEKLAIESIAIFREMDYWADRWNEIHDELGSIGYNNTCWISEYVNGGHTVTEDSLASTVAEYNSDPALACRENCPWHQTKGARHTPPTKTRIRLAERRQSLGEACGWICVYCGQAGIPETGPDGRLWHVDHLFAKTNGGDSASDNLILSCATCNLRKNRALASKILTALSERMGAGRA